MIALGRAPRLHECFFTAGRDFMIAIGAQRDFTRAVGARGNFTGALGAPGDFTIALGARRDLIRRERDWKGDFLNGRAPPPAASAGPARSSRATRRQRNARLPPPSLPPILSRHRAIDTRRSRFPFRTDGDRVEMSPPLQYIMKKVPTRRFLSRSSGQ